MSVEQARYFALQAHDGQTYGTRPYSVHLDAVADIAKPYGDVVQVIAYLHDVVEDTSVVIEQVAALFGEHIAACVGIVTDEAGATRAERKIKTHQKMADVESDLYDALIVKAADRLANMRASESGKREDLLAMYVQEYTEFKQAVYRENLCDDIWLALDDIYQRNQ